MAEAKLTTIASVTLKMTEEEASWLKGLCQNAMIVDETSKDERLRAAIFRALHNAGVCSFGEPKPRTPDPFDKFAAGKL